MDLIHSKKFALRPDIVIREKGSSNNFFALDTKWKILNSNVINQGDMYQMYAYQNNGATNITLIYPFPESSIDLHNYIKYDSRDGVIVNVMFVDLFNIDESIKEIIAHVQEINYAC